MVTLFRVILCSFSLQAVSALSNNEDEASLIQRALRSHTGARLQTTEDLLALNVPEFAKELGVVFPLDMPANLTLSDLLKIATHFLYMFRNDTMLEVMYNSAHNWSIAIDNYIIALTADVRDLADAERTARPDVALSAIEVFLKRQGSAMAEGIGMWVENLVPILKVLEPELKEMIEVISPNATHAPTYESSYNKIFGYGLMGMEWTKQNVYSYVKSLFAAPRAQLFVNRSEFCLRAQKCWGNLTGVDEALPKHAIPWLAEAKAILAGVESVIRSSAAPDVTERFMHWFNETLDIYYTGTVQIAGPLHHAIMASEALLEKQMNCPLPRRVTPPSSDAQGLVPRILVALAALVTWAVLWGP